MIKSMTGFARATVTEKSLTVSVEVRSYNSRHLDTKIRIPYGISALEEKIKALVAEKIVRGRMEMQVTYLDESEDSKAFEIDMAKAKAYHKALLKLKDAFELKGDIAIENILSAGSVIIPKETEDDMEFKWQVVGKCVAESLDQLNAMRLTEGDFLSKDFDDRLAFIEHTLGDIEAGASGIALQYKAKLEERIKTLTKGVIELDPGRLEQEAAYLADKCDISEEIVRARSHIKQFRAIMVSDEPGGRKLNFLLQEFNREFNTIGSKIGNADISHLVVDVKSELEKMREQVQNVE